MAGALNQNLDLANALASFSKTLFGSAPVKVTETEEGGGSTIVKGTSLTPEAINAMLREMTEGGLSGQGSGGIAGLAAIMSGQKSAGLYNSPTTMQLMNKNAVNIAEKAALASAPTTQVTTTAPRTASRTTEQPGLVSTPAGKTGLLLAGASLLKNKKFQKLIGFDDLGSIQDAPAPQSIEAFNQSVVADAAGGDYIGSQIQETLSDSSLIESAGSSVASNFGFEAAGDASFGIASDAGSEFLNSGTDLLSQGIESGAELIGEAAGALDFTDVITDSFDFTDFSAWDWFADGGLVGRDGKKRKEIPGYVDGGVYNARVPEKSTRPVISSGIISSPQTTGPLVLAQKPVVSNPSSSSAKKKSMIGEDEIASLVDGAGGSVGAGVGSTPAVDHANSPMFTSMNQALFAMFANIATDVALGNAANEGIADAAVASATEGTDVGSSIGSSTGAGGGVGTGVGDPTAGDDPAGSGVAGAIGGIGDAGDPGTGTGAADGDASDGGWKSGGEINGKGTGTSDSNIIRVSDGEYIIPADVVEIIGVDFFDGLRERFHTPVSQGKRRMQ